MSTTEKTRSSARLQKVRDNTGLAKAIKALPPLNEEVLSKKASPARKVVKEKIKKNPATMAATKEEIAEMFRKQKTQKSFDPKQFFGSSSENAKEFLASFENYSKLNNMPDTEKILTFEMCLSGAAKIWFLTLSEERRKNFTTISEQFKKDYVQNNQWLNITRLENRKLKSSETAEHYIKDMSNLALLTGIKDDELAKALIRGLPDQLKWHVISFNPTTLSDTIQRILLGEATLTFTGKEEIHAIEENELSVLMKTMDLRLEKLEELFKTNVIEQREFSPHRSRSLPRQYEASCSSCGKYGHKTSQCFVQEQRQRQTMERSQRPWYQYRSDGRNGMENRNYDYQNMRPNRVRFDTRYDNAYNSRQYRNYKPSHGYPKNISTPRM